MPRRGWVLASAVLVSWVLGCSGGGMRAEAEYALTADWGPFDRIIVVTRNGEVGLVVDATRSDVKISGRKSISGVTLEQARENLASVSVVADQSESDPRTLLVRLEYPDELSLRGPSASVRVVVPKTVAVDLTTSNAAIHAAEVSAAKCRTSNGKIELRGVSGNVEGVTSNASISVSDVKGHVSARTSNGRISAERLHSGAELKTSNARIEAVDVYGALQAVSSNGSIRVVAAPHSGDLVRLETSNASIHATLPADLSGDLRLATSNGRVEIHGDKTPMQVRRMTRTAVEAELNQGGKGGLIAGTSNGGVTIVFQ